MKKFEMFANIPNVYIYVGKTEWLDYLNKCVDNGKPFDEDEIETPSKGEGRATNNVMWVEELEFSLLFHELQHIKDFIYFTMDIVTELEFKAVIASELDTAVVQWVLLENMKQYEMQSKEA